MCNEIIVELSPSQSAGETRGGVFCAVLASVVGRNEAWSVIANPLAIIPSFIPSFVLIVGVEKHTRSVRQGANPDRRSLRRGQDHEWGDIESIIA